ncbi:hypothetical protein DL98DRAFT_285483 [Cadophora sp. DSE1049]|nr:hypothetical protein DL98DRAFT_285483 [Cadophora sp. DSE1049]
MLHTFMLVQNNCRFHPSRTDTNCPVCCANNSMSSQPGTQGMPTPNSDTTMRRNPRPTTTSRDPVAQPTGSAQVNNTRVGLLADNTCYPPHTVYHHRGEGHALSPPVLRSGPSKDTGVGMLTNDYRTPLPSDQDHYCERFALTPEDVFRSGPTKESGVGMMTNNYCTPLQSDIDHYCERFALSPEELPKSNREVPRQRTLRKLAPAPRKRTSQMVTIGSPEKSSSEDEDPVRPRRVRMPQAKNRLPHLPKRRKMSKEKQRMEQNLLYQRALENKVAETAAALAHENQLEYLPQDTIVVDSSSITAPTGTGPQTSTRTTRAQRSARLAGKARRTSSESSLDSIAAVSGKVDDEPSDPDAEVIRLTRQAAELEKSASKLRDDANNLRLKAHKQSKARRPSTPESSELSELDSSEFEDL